MRFFETESGDIVAFNFVLAYQLKSYGKEIYCRMTSGDSIKFCNFYLNGMVDIDGEPQGINKEIRQEFFKLFIASFFEKMASYQDDAFLSWAELRYSKSIITENYLAPKKSEV